MGVRLALALGNEAADGDDQRRVLEVPGSQAAKLFLNRPRRPGISVQRHRAEVHGDDGALLAQKRKGRVEGPAADDRQTGALARRNPLPVLAEPSGRVRIEALVLDALGRNGHDLGATGGAVAGGCGQALIESHSHPDDVVAERREAPSEQDEDAIRAESRQEPLAADENVHAPVVPAARARNRRRIR